MKTKKNYILIKNIFIFKLILIFFACKSKTYDLILPDEQAISMDELTTAMQSVRFSESQDFEHTKESMNLKNCIKTVKHISSGLKELRKHLKKSYLYSNTIPYKVSQLSPKHCSGLSYSKTSSLLRQYLSDHPNKIGVLLPLSGEYKDLAESIKKGVLLAETKFIKDHKAKILFEDSNNKAIEALAKLVFKDNISLLIGGLRHSEAATLAPFSNKIALPLLLINKDTKVIEKTSHTLQIYPNEYDLAKSLAHACKKQNFKRITILLPDNGKSDQLSNYFIKFLSEEGIKISNSLKYTPGNYHSMNEVASEITHTKIKNREVEYASLFKQKLVKARTLGEKFNPRAVILPIKIQTDALFIPDTFQTVRYFVKLLKYHGLSNIPLLGTPEWRSHELLEPWDRFIDNSFFVDFIGDYRKVPKGIGNKHLNSKYFVPTQTASLIDFQLIGFRASSIALNTLKAPFLKKRDIFKQLWNQEENGEFFKTKKIFYKNKTSWWPTFIFKINDKKIKLITKWKQ